MPGLVSLERRCVRPFYLKMMGMNAAGDRVPNGRGCAPPRPWEYLDQIWDAADAAERTKLTVLPALMLRAHKESTSQDVNDS